MNTIVSGSKMEAPTVMKRLVVVSGGERERETKCSIKEEEGAHVLTFHFSHYQ